MRLVSCYISGFGQLKDYHFDFTEGLNTIFEENGWGKTTFSAFIKAMLYGMDASRSTKVLIDRKHYLPWDGGQYGGHLVFEVADKQYRVERTFGKTDKDDTFALFDVVTGKISSDYTENLGEELFEVDRSSFEKSIFVPQSALTTAMTDSLNAKMGDLASAKDDINNFDAAVSRVSDARKSYTRKSAVNNGKLNIIKEELSKCNEVIDKKAAVMDGYHKQGELLEEKKRKLNWLEAEKDRVAELIRTQSKHEQEMGAYKKQLEFLQKQQEELSRLDDFFAQGLPELSEQEAMEDVERQWDVSRRTENDLLVKLPLEQQVQKWEALFEHNVPSQVDLEEWNSKANKMQDLRLKGEHSKFSEESKKQLDELEYFFSKKFPTEEELNLMDADAQELSMLEGRIVQQDETYRNLKAKRDVVMSDGQTENLRGSVILFVGLAVAFVIGGLAFHMLTPGAVMLELICYAGAAATIVAALMQGLRIRSSKRSRREDVENQLRDAEEALAQSQEKKEQLTKRTGEFLSDFMLTPTDSISKMIYEIRSNRDAYERLKEEEKNATENTTGTVEEMAEVRMSLYTALGHFADVYGMDLYHEACELNLLEQLKKDAENYQEYSVSKKQMELLRITMKKQDELLRDYMGRFPLEEDLDVSEKLKLIRSNLENYARLHESIAKLQEEIEQTKEEQPQALDQAVSVEELQKKQEEIDEEMKEVHKGITQDRETIITLGDELDAIEEAENRRDVLLEKRAEYERNVELLTKTEEFLQMAKEQFLSKYMSPLRKGMNYYLTMLDAKYSDAAAGLDFDITLDLSVRVMANGTSHSSDYLSHGYQDLVALCARFALVDVLYHKEQPMIVLDDPFTNLDEDKTKRALKLLQDVGRERQIIYFTCHGSRIPTSV